MNDQKFNQKIPSPGDIGAADAAFKTIAVAGQSNIVADSESDTLTVVAGSNITLTTNAITDTLTITSTGGAAAGATVVTSLTAGETITAGQLVYMKSDSQVWLAKSNGTSSEKRPIGISQESKTAGQSMSVLLFGLDANQTGLTAGTLYYLNSTYGGITSTIPSTSGYIIIEAGVATSATGLIFNPRVVGVLA